MPSYAELKTNMLDQEAFDWFRGVMEVIETLDADAYAALMREDVELRMPDGSHLRGPEEVARVLGEQFGRVAFLEHRDISLYGALHHGVHEARVVTTLKDGTTTTAHQTGWVDADEEGRITSARVYG